MSDPVVVGAWVDLTATLRLPRAPDEESAQQLAEAAHGGGYGVVVVSARAVANDGGAHDVESLAALQRALVLTSPELSSVRLVPAPTPLHKSDVSDVVSMVKSLPQGTPRVLRLRAPVDDALLLRRVGDLARGLDALVVVASHDRALAAGAVAVEGAVATRLGLPAVPEASERIAILRIIEVAKLTRARFHVAGVFTAGGAALVEAAAGAGVAVSGSVFASHLLFDETALLEHRYDTRLLQQPPLPSSSSREALIDAVQRGALCVSSGHHFVPKRERDLEMTRASPGLTSLSSTAALLSSVLTPAQLTAALSTTPARLLKMDPPKKTAMTATTATTATTTTAATADDLSRLCDLIRGARS